LSVFKTANSKTRVCNSPIGVYHCS